MQPTIILPHNAILFFGFPNTQTGKKEIEAFEKMVSLLPLELQNLSVKASFETCNMWHFEKSYLFSIPNLKTLEAFQKLIETFGVLNEFATPEETVVSLQSKEYLDNFYKMVQEYNEKTGQ